MEPSWSVQQTKEWVVENFGQDVGECFEEQEIDGEAAIDLAGVGGLDQLIACGLKSVCSQLKFKRLAKPSTLAAQSKESYVADNKGCKLKMTELKNLPPEEKRVYLTIRNKVAKAAHEEWPGNDVPKFRGNAENSSRLDKLVERLHDSGLVNRYFKKPAIRKHIIDTLAERRRNIKNGADYTKGNRQKKSKKVKLEVTDHTSSEQADHEDIDEISVKSVIVTENNKDDQKSEAKDGARGIENKENPESVTSEPDEGNEFKETKSCEDTEPMPDDRERDNYEETKSYEDTEPMPDDEERNMNKDDVYVTDESINDHIHKDTNVKKRKLLKDNVYVTDESIGEHIHEDANVKKRKLLKGNDTSHTVVKHRQMLFTFESSEEELSEDDSNGDPLKGLTLKSAEVVVLVAFESHTFKQISRSQLESAGKTLNIPIAIRRSLIKGGKIDYLIPLAKGFLQEGIVKIKKEASLASLSRESVKKAKTF